MNSSIVRYVLGQVLKVEAALLCLPCIVAVIYQETHGALFFGTAVFSFLLGVAMTFVPPQNTVFYLKEGCVATALSWILLSMVGALPLWLSGDIPSYTDALFEVISGFTTTGASILNNVEGLTHSSLFWRSFTHWVGGMGVLVFLLAIIPLTGGSNINLMRAESPGPSVGKLAPKIKYTARILYIIYFGLTALEIVLLLFAKMPFFDALTTAFGTAGTGGFGIKNDSIVGYSAAIQWIVTIFMILFGVNFNAYYYILFHNVRKALGMEEVRAYLAIILASIIVICLDISHLFQSGFEALTHASFQVASIITTTGFSTADFDLWPQTSRTILVILMFVGACAGSTGGGIKVSRFIILFKTMMKELGSYIHPRSVKKIQMDEKPLEHDVVRSVNVYLITFITVFTVSLLLISAEGKDLTTNFTAVAATINNIGPGLSMVGPTQNFYHFSNFSKYILMFDMLAGRLELFPLLILFHPAIWKESICRSRFEKKNKSVHNSSNT